MKKAIGFVIIVLIGVAISAIRERNIRGNALWFADVPTADLGIDMRGKRVIVTGANAGIGKNIAAAIVAQGAHVIMACRSLERGEAARSDVEALAKDLQLTRQAHGDGSAQVELLDLASFESIDAFVGRLKEPVDVLINNAAIASDNERVTADNLPEVMGVNHIGVFRLTLSLLNANLVKSRVVTVSSDAHKYANLSVADADAFLHRHDQGRTEGFVVYSSSKLANLLFTRELAERRNDIVSVCVHPGFIATSLARRLDGIWVFIFNVLSNLFAMDSWQGAQNTIYAATHPDAAALDGNYLVQFFNTEPKLPEAHVQKEAWLLSEQIAQIKLN